MAIFPILGTIDTAEEQVELMYVAYFGRAGDPPGVQSWINALNLGAPIEDIARDFANQEESRGDAFADPREDLHHGIDTFDRPEVRDVNHELRVVALREAPPQQRVRSPPVQRAIDEVGNDVDLAADAELPSRRIGEALRDRRHAVRLLDGIRHDLRVRRIAPD